MMDHKAQQAAREFAAKQLQVTHPHLVAAAGNSLVAAAKNIRIELKRAFPAVKFAVRTSRFSMGDAIDVSWTDGPTTAQVDPILGKYQAGSFDGMTDCYNYERSAWADAFGDAKYVHSHRENSSRAIEAAIRTVFTRYAGNLEGVARPTAEQLQAGRLWSVFIPGLANNDLQQLIMRELGRRTWAIAQEVR